MGQDAYHPDGFDISRAELFEALGHAVRIRILESLREETLGFSDLKRRVALASSGHLQFHLDKLGSLVKKTLEGDYALTDEGREALTLVATLRRTGDLSEDQGSRTGLRPNRRTLFEVALVGLVVIVAFFAGAKQQESLVLNTDRAMLQSQVSELEKRITMLESQRTKLDDALRFLTSSGPLQLWHSLVRSVDSPSISASAVVIATVRTVSSPQRFHVISQPLFDNSTVQKEGHFFGIHLYNGSRIQITVNASAAIDFEIRRNARATLSWMNDFETTGPTIFSRGNVVSFSYLLSVVEEGDFVFVFAKDASVPPVADVAFMAEYSSVT